MIPGRIEAYFDKISGGVPGRYRSWDHCYVHFRQFAAPGPAVDRRTAALHLAFYLASWGMYRGSSFLLRYDFTVHEAVVDGLTDKRFAPLWEREIGGSRDDGEFAPLILDVVEAVRRAYRPYGDATDTLITKVLLGTIGCLPAVDRFFIVGFAASGFKYSYVNRNFIGRVIDFCVENANVLKKEQVRIREMGGGHYPMMKLIDMYFWQVGFEQSPEFVVE
jgi:hypothetical protein